jgi:Copper chaperone
VTVVRISTIHPLGVLARHTGRGYVWTVDVQRYTVVGMTCDHCVRSVTEEVSEIDGVSGVAVELSTGVLTLTGPASDADVRAAVEEAGYRLAG